MKKKLHKTAALSAAHTGHSGSAAEARLDQLEPEELLAVFSRENHPLRLDHLLRVLHLPRRAKKELESCLNELARRGHLLRLRGGQWARTDSLRSLLGRYQALRTGGGFVTPLSVQTTRAATADSQADDTADSSRHAGHETSVTGGRDVFIHPLQTNGAWHQDLVRVVLTPGRSSGPNPEGRIVEIIERVQKEVPVHVHDHTGRTLFCRPADSRLTAAFSVALPPEQSLPERGTLLLVAPEKELASDLWQARLLGSYGREDDADVQENLVKLNHEVPHDFPPSVLAEAAALPEAPTEADLEGREDLRALPLVTIDGADARDFDDAVQVERQGQGWLLRVAIADVSHYVRPTPGRHISLDSEALARGNSWYFPRSVEPMLPPALSNGLCSLNPHVDRLCMLAEIPFSASGKPGKPHFAPAVMRSAARLTYDTVKACLLDRDPAALARLRGQERGPEVLAMLEEAFALFAVLREARRQRGSLDFDLPEAQYRFQADGRVAGIGFRQRHDAHRLIEEFMIAANEAVARFLEAADMPFLYRVHPEPDPDRLDSLYETLASSAVGSLPAGQLRDRRGRPNAGAMQAILAAAQGTDQEYVVNRLCLRAMPQARYQPENEGHFGLASQSYCHFTSPIRRYADLLVHRALKTRLGLSVGPLPAGQKLLRIGDQLNRRERAAIDCEREMARRLGCLLLAEQVGQRFEAVIAGVTDFGIFVELASTPVEGIIRMEDLGDDWYELDSQHQCLRGQHSGLCWQLGQSLQVRLAEVHLGRLEIRFMPLELPKAARSSRHRLPHQRRGRADHAGRAAGRSRPLRREDGQEGRQKHSSKKDRPPRVKGATTGRRAEGQEKKTAGKSRYGRPASQPADRRRSGRGRG